MLELNKLTKQVDGMAEALAGQRDRQRKATEAARELLLKHAQVTDELRAEDRDGPARSMKAGAARTRWATT